VVHSDATHKEPRPRALISSRRAAPKELAVVVILGVASGIGEVILGVVVVFARYADSIQGTSAYSLVTITGAALILLGLLTAAVASGLLRADRTARIVCTVLLALGVAAHVATLLMSTSTAVAAAIAALLCVAAIIVMWTGRSSRWFGHPTV
jgi:hypothetical protein